MFKLSTVPLEHIQRKNVQFSFRDGDIVTIRTFILSDQGMFKISNEQICKPTLLVIHGFGGSACLLYPIYKQLLEHYRVVTIDMLGFGASSRIAINESILSSPTATENYLISWLQGWLN